MQAAFKKNGEVYLREITLRPLKLGEIRVKVTACGVCGTDILAGQDSAEEKILTGHEIAGIIQELGPGVAGLQVGQKIVLDSSTPCGHCDQCRNTRQELCTDLQSFFFTGFFGFADELIVPAICAIPCEDLDPAVATLQEPLGVAIDMVRLADIQINSNVLILGQGPIGLMATALVKRAGARRIFVTDFKQRQRRVELAKQFGADAFIDPSETPVEKYPFGCAIDRILMTAPPKALNGAFAVAAKGAIISFIGIAHGDGAFCTFDVNDFHFKKLQLRASFASPALFGPLALQYLREGVVDGPAMISHRFPLTDIKKALDTARRDPAAVKVAVLP